MEEERSESQKIKQAASEAAAALAKAAEEARVVIGEARGEARQKVVAESGPNNWLKFIAPFLIGLCGTLLGAGISWGVATQKQDELNRRVSAVEVGFTNLNKQVNDDRVYLAGQLGEIKAKLDSLQKN